MTNSERFHRQDAFLEVYRAVREVIDGATLLSEQLETDPDAQYAFSAERAGADYFYQDLNWDHVRPSLARLKEAIHEELIRALDNETVDDIKCALHHAEEALPFPGQLGGNPRILAEVVNHLEWAVEALNEFCQQWATSVFGVWGAYWFDVAANSRFPLDHTDYWPRIELPPAEVLSLMTKPEDDETGQEWADAAEARNQWIYEQVMAGVKYNQIIAGLKGRPTKWQRISSIPGIKAVAAKYAKQHGLPEPKPRPPGRPPGR